MDFSSRKSIPEFQFTQKQERGRVLAFLISHITYNKRFKWIICTWKGSVEVLLLVTVYCLGTEGRKGVNAGWVISPAYDKYCVCDIFRVILPCDPTADEGLFHICIAAISVSSILVSLYSSFSFFQFVSSFFQLVPWYTVMVIDQYALVRTKKQTIFGYFKMHLCVEI